MNEKIFYAAVLALSVLFLVAGNRLAGEMPTAGDTIYDPHYYSARVIEILDRTEVDESWFSSIYITFTARLGSGDIVTAEQHISDMFLVTEREIAAGDRVVLAYDWFSGQYVFVTFARINYVLILGAVFLAAVLLFGQRKGFSSVISLGLTCAAVFFVFIPAILAGRNIYAATIIICVFAVVSTLLLVIGPNVKAVSAMLGCLGGVAAAGLLMSAMDAVLGLTGALDQDTQVLLLLPTENPVNLRAIIFAGVVLGAVGAIMDVAMSIASSLWEVREAGGVDDFRGLVKSGLNIGRDILGTMLNTLILAYIGSSLSLILLITVHTTSFLELFNMEMIIVEILRALIGSLGMLLTIPLTAAICAWLYGEREGSL